jgi:hypothetical protein
VPAGRGTPVAGAKALQTCLDAPPTVGSPSRLRRPTTIASPEPYRRHCRDAVAKLFAPRQAAAASICSCASTCPLRQRRADLPQWLPRRSSRAGRAEPCHSNSGRFSTELSTPSCSTPAAENPRLDGEAPHFPLLRRAAQRSPAQFCRHAALAAGAAPPSPAVSESARAARGPARCGPACGGSAKRQPVQSLSPLRPLWPAHAIPANVATGRETQVRAVLLVDLSSASFHIEFPNSISRTISNCSSLAKFI